MLLSSENFNIFDIKTTEGIQKQDIDQERRSRENESKNKDKI